MIHRTILALLLVVVGLLLWATFEQREQVTQEQIRTMLNLATDKVSLKIENHWSDRNMTSHVTWKDSAGGTTVSTVPTEKRPGESQEDLYTRHLADVAAFKAAVIAQGGTIL